MSSKVFENCFTLNFRNKKIENEYLEMKTKKLEYYNYKILLFSFIVSLCISIYSFTIKDDEIENTNLFLFNIIMTSIAFSSYFILAMYLLFAKINIKILEWSNYYIYYFQIFVFISIRDIFFKQDNTHMLHFFEYLFEIIIRLTWVVLYLHSFCQCMILNLLCLITEWIVISTLIPEDKFKHEMIHAFAYSFVIIAIIGIGYLMDRQQKLAFYFNWQAEAKAKWLNNVFENLNSGFVSFKDGSINNINSFLKNQVEKLNNKKIKNKSLVKDVYYYETTLNTKENKLFLFKSEFEHMIKPVLKILAQINTESISDKSVSKVLSNFKHEISKIKTEDKLEKMKKFSTIINNLIKSFSKISSIENFIYIGDISYIIDENEIYYEVLCRHNFSDADGSLEILFNDVTRVRQREKQNAEFKYKSLFLSKVAHEFKNPLICITELINQSCEILPRKAKRNQKIMSNLEQTKSLSNFMQILIKDLNYFSESQIGKTIEFTYKETDLFELLDFCDKITNTLLLKSNKKEKIEFMIKRCENIPDKITTDESRLKQLLVNLLSNSVKFTLHGQIKLEICIENKCEENFSKRFLKFQVKDTGVGIDDLTKIKLFQPFQKGNMSSNTVSNEIGTGLGLYISNEIASKIGEGLEYSSIQGEGTTFSFLLTLPNQEKENILNHELKDSQITSNYNIPLITVNGSTKSEYNSLKNNCESENFTDKFNHQQDLPIEKLNFVENEEESQETVKLNEFENTMSKPSSYLSHLSLSEDSEDISETEEHEEVYSNTEINFNSSKIDSKSKPRLSKFFRSNKEISSSFKRNRNKCFTSKKLDNYLETIFKRKKTEKTLSQEEKIQPPSYFMSNPFQEQKLNRNYFSSNLILNKFSRISNDFNDLTTFNIIVVDDESLTRLSTIRTLKIIFKTLNLNVNIIEAEDGIETIFYVYKSCSNGYKISLILSDENMNFMNGIRSSAIIKELLNKKKMGEIPFYLVTAYDSSVIDKSESCNVTKVLEKPLNSKIASKILKNLFIP